MDLAATCAALLHLLGLGGRREEQLPAEADPADMGTAYGLEASLAPTPSVPPSNEAGTRLRTNDQNAWLRPH